MRRRKRRRIREAFCEQKERRQVLSLQAENDLASFANSIRGKATSRFESANSAPNRNKQGHENVSLFIWRRIRDSNSGTLLQVTRFLGSAPSHLMRILQKSSIAKQVYHIFSEKSSAFLFLFGFILLKSACIYAKIISKTKTDKK